MLQNPNDKTIIVQLTDEAFRSNRKWRTAELLTHILDVQGIPRFFSPLDRALLRGFQTFGGWLPGEVLTPFEALRGFTRDAAWAGFAEGDVGMLAEGMRADFVVLAQDPLGIPATGLDDLTVLSTWVDGEPVYRK